MKYHKIKISFFIICFLTSCQLQDPDKNHGILFLENRSEKLVVNKFNKNDVVKVMGQPHSKSVTDIDIWLYFERTLTTGKYHKLGKKILKVNNTLVLSFDKYGVLKTKDLYKKEDINKIAFSDKKTRNELTQKSFIEKFLSSVKQKMYGNR